MKKSLYLPFCIIFFVVGNAIGQNLCTSIGWATQTGRITGGEDDSPGTYFLKVEGKYYKIVKM